MAEGIVAWLRLQQTNPLAAAREQLDIAALAPKAFTGRNDLLHPPRQMGQSISSRAVWAPRSGRHVSPTRLS